MQGTSSRQDPLGAALEVLSLAFDARALGNVFEDPREDPTAPLPTERVFLTNWVDYSYKYGMGYALTNGSFGVWFLDDTTMVLNADKKHFEYYSIAPGVSNMHVRSQYTLNDYPRNLKSKLNLLNHFRWYITDKLHSGIFGCNWLDTERTEGMARVKKYVKMKHVVVFEMSHGVLQFNFVDRTKIALSSGGLVVNVVDKEGHLTRWTLRDIMEKSLRIRELNNHRTGPLTAAKDMDANEMRIVQILVDKLKYCRAALRSIKSQPRTQEK